jgi:hypothetical protein
MDMHAFENRVCPPTDKELFQGCSVIWSYMELFGYDRLSKAIFVDQAPLQNTTPDWKTGSKGCYDGPSLARLQAALHADMGAFAKGTMLLVLQLPLDLTPGSTRESAVQHFNDFPVHGLYKMLYLHFAPWISLDPDHVMDVNISAQVTPRTPAVGGRSSVCWGCHSRKTDSKHEEIWTCSLTGTCTCVLVSERIEQGTASMCLHNVHSHAQHCCTFH